MENSLLVTILVILAILALIIWIVRAGRGPRI